MKGTQLKWILCCMSVCFLEGTSFAQAEYGVIPRSDDTSQAVVTQSKQFCRSKDLVGANVKDAQGQKLGDISEIYLNPQNGQTFAAIGTGRGHHALVPLQALTVMPARGVFRNAEVTLNKSKAELESGPSVAGNDWQKLDDAAFTQSIYSHYNLQPPTAVGGAGEPGDVTTGAGKKDTSESREQRQEQKEQKQSKEPQEQKEQK